MSATLAAPVAPPPKNPPVLLSAALARLRRFTRAEYHRLGELGIIDPDEKLELLDGLIVEKPIKGPLHVAVTRRLIARMPRHLPAGWFVQTQDPIGLAASEPEPDAAILRGDETSYDTRHPEPLNIGIVIEVAESTLPTDRREKGRLYAQAALPVYWIVNVADGQIEVYTDPNPAANPPAYASRTDYLLEQDSHRSRWLTGRDDPRRGLDPLTWVHRAN
jgi:Uma2 family endonuclease